MSHGNQRSNRERFDDLIKTMSSMNPRETTWRQFWDRLAVEHGDFMRQMEAPEATPELKQMANSMSHYAYDGAPFTGWLHFSPDDLINPPHPMPLVEAARRLGNMEDTLVRLHAAAPEQLDADSFEEEALYFRRAVAEEDWPEIYERLKELHRKFFRTQ